MAGLYSGQHISGTGIPSGATVVSVGVSSIVISANTTVAGTGVTLTFTGRQFGSTQQDDNKAHTHTSDHAHVASNAQSYGPLRTNGAVSAVAGWIPAGQGGTGALTTNTNSANIGSTGTESRPKNVALLPCIKY